MTFSELLAAQLRHEPGRPLLTWYDERTGERVELSVTTYANWVAKTASLLVDEHDLERGDVLLVDLPAHWLGPVFLGAAWAAGLAVAFPADAATDSAAPAAVVCGPEGLATWAPRAGDVPVLACSLLPMGVRFAEPLPPEVHDVGVEVWGQPDAFIPYDPPDGDDVALRLVDGPVTQDELFSDGAGSAAETARLSDSTASAAAGTPRLSDSTASAAAGTPRLSDSTASAAAGTPRLSASTAAGSLHSTDGGRLLSAVNPASPPGVTAAARALVSSGSLVLVTGADSTRLDEIAEAERVTGRLLA